MKFTIFGKALLISALSAALILCVTSCVESYDVGYLYVTGTDTAQSSGNGIISGFAIDHNTGFMTPVRTLPVASGGANPVRAVLTTAAVSCMSSIAALTIRAATAPQQIPHRLQHHLFAVGGHGILTQQEQFYTQGINPFRMIVDTTQSFLMVLDHDSPYRPTHPTRTVRSSRPVRRPQPVLRCGLDRRHVCGDITIFSINPTTGRLSLVLNQQVTAAGGASLTYFPVPSNPVDFITFTGYILTLSSTAVQPATLHRRLNGLPIHL